MVNLSKRVETEEDLFSGKKKKAKKILVNADEGGEEVTGEGDDLDFSSLKKKKKRVIDEQVAALDAQLEEAGIVDDKEVEVEGDEDPFKAEGGEEAAPENEE